MSGRSCRLDHLVADVQEASPDLSPGDFGWLSAVGHGELCAYIERYLATEVDDVRYLVEERVRDALGKIAKNLRTLREPTPPNVRARVHDICRREKSNELKRLRVRLRETLPPDGANALDSVAAPGGDRPAAKVDGDHVRTTLLQAVTRASQAIPVQYNVWRMSQRGLTHEAIAEQLGLTARTVRNYLVSFQAFIIYDLMQHGFEDDDLLQMGIKRNDLPKLIRKGRKFQRQRKRERSRRNEQP